jgi:D-3-phosphoglycerate dehydrogenase
MMDKIIICDLDHSDINAETAVLQQAGFHCRWLHCKTQQETIEQCKGAVVLLNQYVKMDRVIFEALPTVKCVVRYGVGYDNVNFEDAGRYGLQVCNIPDYGINEVADQTIGIYDGSGTENSSCKQSYPNRRMGQKYLYTDSARAPLVSAA